MSKVTITGLAALERKLRALPAVVERAAKRAIEGEVDEAVEDLRLAAPVLSGDLRDSTQGEIDKGGLAGVVAITAGHAEYVIHGTDDTPANDYVTPVEVEMRRRFPDRFIDEVNEEMRRL